MSGEHPPSPPLFCEIKLDLICMLLRCKSVSQENLNCSHNLPPSQDVNLSDLENLVLQLPALFILIGDCNAPFASLPPPPALTIG